MTARSLSGLVRTMAVAGLLVVAGLGSATTAAAHSQLERTDPVDGSQVATLPAQITLTFNQNVLGLGSAVQVTGPSGSVADGPPTVVNNQLQQAIQPGSGAGDYTVLWRVTSADGHPISGRFAFSAAAGSAGSDAAAGSGGSGAESGGLAIWVLLGCVAVVLAGGVFLIARRSGPSQTADDESPAEDPADDVKVREKHS